MEKRVHLKGRLLAISEYAKNGGVIADIGTDHGRLCISLIQTGNADFAYATDISAPSLEKAKQLCNKCSLNDKMEFVVTDGLCGLTAHIDTIIIAGMGGELIAEILEKEPKTAHNAKRLILQPMRGIRELRKYLYEAGYKIEQERLCKEAGRIYQIISAVHCGNAQEWFKLPDDFYEFGEKMLKDELMTEYIERLKAEYRRSIENAGKHDIRLSSIEKVLCDIETIQCTQQNKEENR